MAPKADFKKTLDVYRAKRGEFRRIDVPPMTYIAVDGRGDPNTAQEYADALAALYPVAYALKAVSRRDLDRDYVVMPLEGLWWAPDREAFTTARDKSRWHWTMLIMVPGWTTEGMLAESAGRVRAKRAPASLGSVALRTLAEGSCVQTLHVGSFDDEGPVIERMHREFIIGAGLGMTGPHHEIYLSDPRRTEPARLRTILRQPVMAPAA